MCCYWLLSNHGTPCQKYRALSWQSPEGSVCGAEYEMLRPDFVIFWQPRHILLSQKLRGSAPTLQVVVDLAAQQPLPRRHGDHLSGDKGGWEQADGVAAVTAVQKRAALEVGGVNVHLVPHAKQVHGHTTELAQLNAGQVTVHVPVDSYQRAEKGREEENTHGACQARRVTM